jgi:CPA1 family monovalent cation:H+ antiporter
MKNKFNYFTEKNPIENSKSGILQVNLSQFMSQKFTRMIFLCIVLFSVIMVGSSDAKAKAPEYPNKFFPSYLAKNSAENASNPLVSPKAEGEENEDEEQVIAFITTVIGLLLIASLVGIVTNRLRLPYTVGLVLIGLALSLRGQENIEIPPGIFLGLLVPPLIFEAAFHIKIKDLVKDLAPILALAIPGVLITTLLVGAVVTWGTGFPIATSLVFGALVAATDPVAVVALFRSLGVPKRLQVLLEGESLFNDGTAIVVFNLMVVISVTQEFQLIQSILEFIVVAGGGLAVGFLLAVILSQAIRFIDDPLIVTTLTTVLAFGSYITAEQFHVSGVLAVVAAGLVSGNIGPKGMSPSTRILVYNFWDFAAFLANSVVFLLIGLQINLLVLLADWQVILWAILAVLVARAVSVYGLSWVGKGISMKYKNVIYWGGLRGAISLALAISLPATLGPAREEIQAMAFGVVLFTLLVQGLSMKPLINKLKLVQRNDAQEEYERRHARSVMAKASYQRLDDMYQSGLISTHIWKLMSKPLKQHAKVLAEAVTEALQADPAVENEIYDTAIREMLASQRNALNMLLRDGIIAEETYAQLVVEVDTAMADPQTNQIEIVLNRQKNPITGLMSIVIQDSDVENITAVLNRLGTPVTRLSSSGGFLGRKNTTLLIGIPENKEPVILQAIRKTSKQRVEFLPASTDKSSKDPSDLDDNLSVTVMGATAFTFDVERYEEV